MAASRWNQALVHNKRWTSESKSGQTASASKSGGTATAHARSASRSNIPTSDLTKTSTAGSRRSVRTTASDKSGSRRSTSLSGNSGNSSTATKTPGSGGPVSRSLGPSSIPSGGPSTGHNNTIDSSEPGLTSGAKKAIIVATVIGGILILVVLIILIYRLFRRKNKRAKVIDAPYLRPPSTTTFLSTKTRDANLTALPMYRERRRQQAEAANRPSRILPDMQELYKHDPRLQDVWKTANPPTPITGQFPSDEDEHGDAYLTPPEMAQVRGVSPVLRLSSHNATNVDPAESIYAPSAIDLEAGEWSHTPTTEQPFHDRWSWTTSYATAKSKDGAQSLASTIASLPGMRRVKEWIDSPSNGQRESNTIPEGESGPSRTSSVTFLKNKATKPNLAPVHTRELSRTQFQSESGPTTINSGQPHATERTNVEVTLDAIDAMVPDDGVFS